MTSPETGTVTIGTNGMASVTVNTAYTNIGSAGLTFEVTSVTPNPTDTITVNAPAIQNFTAVVGETLLGGPENTIFKGAVDDLTVGQNTYTSVLDSAMGNINFHPGTATDHQGHRAAQGGRPGGPQGHIGDRQGGGL